MRLVADGPADNRAEQVRRIPPPGLAIPDADRAALSEGVRTLAAELESLRPALTNRPALLGVLPDVEALHKAVDWALRHDEFFRTNEVASAQALLEAARARAAALREGRTPWLETPGPTVLGYRSRIDDSVQPYGLVIPDTFAPRSPHAFRLDVWFHGRGEQLSELAFCTDRMRNRGEFTPPNAFVLHPYGRYCNGSRFAGETDLWEALADARRRFPVDEDRLVVRGFSLGGAACWHTALHHASVWAAAAPGAGFSETAEFLKVFQNETLKPAPWEQQLWQLHDATAVALNAGMVPLVAYSGADDRQKQAADAMASAMASWGLELTHLVGPKTGHSYERGARAEINRRVDAIALRGRDPLPRRVRFLTPTLRYPTQAWVTLEALGRHWDLAYTDALLQPEEQRVDLVVTNVEALTLHLPPGLSPFDPSRPVGIRIGGVTLRGPTPESDRSWTALLHRMNGAWEIGSRPSGGLRKRHGLQGPVDDAFMDSFLFVRPTGPPLNAAVGAWATNEMAHAIEHWRRQYRGDVRVKDDTAVTDADQAAHHLVLWGDPQSNALIGRVASRLGVRWDATGVHTPEANYPADRYVAVEVYPNPLNPERYVVLNSGFTFREYDYLNNARQTPKLPDWAVLDITQPPTSRAAGRLEAAGFFGEDWQWKR
ncbi:MAG: prolyl oligopeptidase family serine peptidase [Verrucomicrobia bacterium]|nr:prolyl oligopeptidase family serine peptidase [Verrucomicrobiota bacterium]